MLGIKRGYTEVVKILLEAKADLTLTNKVRANAHHQVYIIQLKYMHCVTGPCHTYRYMHVHVVKLIILFTGWVDNIDVCYPKQSLRHCRATTEPQG